MINNFVFVFIRFQTDEEIFEGIQRSNNKMNEKKESKGKLI